MSVNKTDESKLKDILAQINLKHNNELFREKGGFNYFKDNKAFIIDFNFKNFAFEDEHTIKDAKAFFETLQANGYEAISLTMQHSINGSRMLEVLSPDEIGFDKYIKNADYDENGIISKGFLIITKDKESLDEVLTYYGKERKCGLYDFISEESLEYYIEFKELELQFSHNYDAIKECINNNLKNPNDKINDKHFIHLAQISKELPLKTIALFTQNHQSQTHTNTR